jgi:hypothetical protein
MITRALKSGARWLMRIVVFLLIVSLAINAFSYANFDFKYDFLKLKQQAIATGWYLPAYYSHVLVAAAILLIGFFQLNSKISLRWKKVHRLLGRCYAYGILFFAAPGGLVMSFFILRGPWVLSSFLLQCLLWFSFTAIAVNKIVKGDTAEHKKWMIRSYALTFAAVTLRLYIFASSPTFDLSSPVAYGIIAWASWTINLLAVEGYFFWNRMQT